MTLALGASKSELDLTLLRQTTMIEEDALGAKEERAGGGRSRREEERAGVDALGVRKSEMEVDALGVRKSEQEVGEE